MNTSSNAVPEAFESQRVAPVAASVTRPLYWSVRRELWEHRSIYLAPLAVAVLILVGFAVSAFHLPAKMRAAAALDAMQQHEVIEKPYDTAALLLMGTFLVVAIFYCLDALYGERRDRSILFWKSLPVSDLTIVLSKASIPFVILPVFVWVVTVVTQLIMLLIHTGVLLASGQSVAMLWTHVPMVRMSLMLLYHLMAMHSLMYAPFYAWMLLVSGWARRAPFLWAVLPPLAIGFVEKIAFNTSHFGAALLERFAGGHDPVVYPAQNSVMQEMGLINLGRFLITPSLWIGLAFAAVCLGAAVRLRRYQGPA
jgi:ABC-2 type transport system permease protein